MKPSRFIYLFFAASLLLISEPEAWGQGRSNNQGKGKEKKENKGKGKKDYKYDDDRYEDNRPATTRKNSGVLGGVLGRVILPPAGTAGPRQLQGVPPGHYPPPGSCRIWYPNRPPGHQPRPTSCDNLRGVRLEPGAFVLHGSRAYDADYNWQEEERRRPGSVGRDILEVLFPARR